MSRIVLGVCGGIAAYKSAEILREFSERGHDVHVVPTDNALRFIGKATLEGLSGNPVHTHVWEGVARVEHVRLGQQADLVVVAPATADFLARAVHGIANDLLTNVLLTATCPVVIAPAMHTQMWEHPATVASVNTLRERGFTVLTPASGRLTGSDSGVGRLPDPATIFDAGIAALGGLSGLLKGVRVVISAGGTQEDWDPVRFMGNRSSGKQGVAIARAAVAAGALVTFVTGSISVPVPAGVTHIQALSGSDMYSHLSACAEQGLDVLIMSAAVADFRPKKIAAEKMKKDAQAAGGYVLELEETRDILATLSAEIRSRVQGAGVPIIVGFAAETHRDPERLIESGRVKAMEKGCDFVVVNDVSGGKVFGSDTNEVYIVGTDSASGPVAGAKEDIAFAVVHELVRRLDSVDSHART